MNRSTFDKLRELSNKGWDLAISIAGDLNDLDKLISEVSTLKSNLSKEDDEILAAIEDLRDQSWLCEQEAAFADISLKLEEYEENGFIDE